ncbi:MAG: methyltransferase domain-containing protein [Acidobacteriota bacterium]
MKWLPLRKSSGEPLAVTMAGIKLGNRLLLVGASDPVLIAGLAVKTGLTGRACVVDADDTVLTNAAAIVAREGALIETLAAPYISLPFEAEAFDVAVVRDVLAGLESYVRTACLAEVHRVLRPGGRCLVVDTAPTGLAALLRRTPADADYGTHDGPARTLESGGFRAVRTLAQSEGLLFAEGIKANL